jgi:hypothetical protein
MLHNITGVCSCLVNRVVIVASIVPNVAAVVLYPCCLLDAAAAAAAAAAVCYRRGAQMFRKVHVPLLGLVENMSCFICPKCGHSEAIFGEGGGATTAADLGMELLGQVGGLRQQQQQQWRRQRRHHPASHVLSVTTVKPSFGEGGRATTAADLVKELLGQVGGLSETSTAAIASMQCCRQARARTFASSGAQQGNLEWFRGVSQAGFERVRGPNPAQMLPNFCHSFASVGVTASMSVRHKCRRACGSF